MLLKKGTKIEFVLVRVGEASQYTREVFTRQAAKDLCFRMQTMKGLPITSTDGSVAGRMEDCRFENDSVVVVATVQSDMDVPEAQGVSIGLRLG